MDSTSQAKLHFPMLSSRKPFISLSIAFIPTNTSAQSTDTTVEPSYVPDPSCCGTIVLLLSSTLALILCLWTAVHINIVKKPHHRQDPYSKIPVAFNRPLGPRSSSLSCFRTME